ncbi:DUF3305 domain-containing protein [Thalassococcus sp. S3]|uniref:DUF3305 domain-containing protein n=1 Tax=Thalassococcus sp. S3 TaxID=2017482 RepID=UPI0010244107|nr:DUF3305 domain-containing protein [Thalassococcus sp. S3]QBF32393.1 molybdopterin-guanine dinucleotide biosynthesis protein MobA [Thalassococcus sp. S3]
MPLGIVIRKTPGVTRWAAWCWRAVAVLPGAAPATWTELRRDGDAVEYHAGTPTLTLWAAEAEAYLANLSDQVPSIYVVMREETEDDTPFEIVLVTASPYEGQDYADSSEELVEKVPMPPGLIAWIRNYALAHHEHEDFVKRRRDRKRVDLAEDGVGDARISQLSDVYRAPKRVMQ